MYKKFLFLAVLTVFYFLANSQVTKDNWLVGGNGYLTSQKETLFSSEVRGFNFQLSPDIGYFFIDKFAGGVRAKLSFSKVKFNGGVSKTTQLGIGPFLRYYFLAPDHRINVFTDTAYQYVSSSGNNGIASNTADRLTFSAGPVIYFNSSVGIEVAANYELYNNKDVNSSAKTISLSIGFQIHLEK